MIISGVPTSLRTVFTQAHHHQHPVPLNDNDLAELQSILRPQVTLDAGTISKITRAVRTSASTRNYPSSSVVNTMPVQYDHLPVVNSATLFMDTDCCVCYEPMDDRVALPLPPYVLLPVSLHDRCQPATEELCEMSYSIHSRIGIPCRRRGRTRTGTCTGGRQNALNFTTPSTRWPTLSGSTKNAQAPVKRSSL
jgi:hypothetical protein